jgi:hypothetical protein
MSFTCPVGSMATWQGHRSDGTYIHPLFASSLPVQEAATMRQAGLYDKQTDTHTVLKL